MEKEIKFKVYDKQDKKMLKHIYKIGMGFPSPIDCYHLMQFVGFNDKNGEEIYEKFNIVEFTFTVHRDISDYEETVIGIIELDLTFQLGYVVNSLGVKRRIVNSDLKEIKIIGNIYENPDLLKV